MDKKEKKGWWKWTTEITHVVGIIFMIILTILGSIITYLLATAEYRPHFEVISKPILVKENQKGIEDILLTVNVENERKDIKIENFKKLDLKVAFLDESGSIIKEYEFIKD